MSHTLASLHSSERKKHTHTYGDENLITTLWWLFLSTHLVGQVLIQFHRPSVCQSKRRLSQENFKKITLHAMNSGFCRNAQSCKVKALSQADLARYSVRGCVFMCMCENVCFLSKQKYTPRRIIVQYHSLEIRTQTKLLILQNGLLNLYLIGTFY